jgi:hypothetical protein
MRNAIQILFILLATMTCCFHESFGQTKDEVIKHNIIRVDSEMSNGKYKSISSTYYDKSGNNVMTIFIADSSTKFIGYNQFNDSLLVKLIETKFEFNKMVDSQVTRFDYKLNFKGLITENKKTEPSGQIIIDKYIYNDAGQYDTTYREEIDKASSHIIITEYCKYARINNKVISYCYDSLGWNSPNFTITESIYIDTLKEFTIKECKTDSNNCKTHHVKMIYKDGRMTQYEDVRAGIFVRHKYETNKQGLVTRQITQSKYPNEESTRVATIKYYFRK